MMSFIRSTGAVLGNVLLAMVVLGCAIDPETEPTPSPGLEGDSLTSADGWYRDAIFYHVWVNAFSDSDGDGVGDIDGITQKLGYLDDLGITGLWLSPFFKNASTAINLHGYDTTDHYLVDPRFGTNEDLEELLIEAHNRGIRVIFDWVPNHLSSQHPWFVQSTNPSSEKRDWFLWRDDPGSQNGPWGQSVWHRRNGDYYYGVFWEGMPDVNYGNEDAHRAMIDVVTHWLDFGFDGMRVDAVKYIYEDPNAIAGGYDDQPETFRFFNTIREEVLEPYAEAGYAKFMVAENWTSNRDSLLAYMDTPEGPAFNMTLDFPFAYGAANRSASELISHWNWVESLGVNGTVGTFLSNHDNVVNRPASVHPNEAAYKAVVAAQFTGMGTPFVYYGNEIGMADELPADAGLVGHEDRRHRQPFKWDWQRTQENDDDSILSWHQDLIELRHQRISLRRGSFDSIDHDYGNLLLFERWHQDEGSLVAINLGADPLSLDIAAANGTTLLQGNGTNITVSGDQLGLELPAYAVAVLAIEEPISLESSPTSSFYLRGTMNNWGASVMTPAVQDSQNVWKTTDAVDLDAGVEVQFKFTYASSPSSWSQGVYGNSQLSYTILDQSPSYDATDISGSIGDDNVTFVPKASGGYYFVVIADDPASGNSFQWTLVPE